MPADKVKLICAGDPRLVTEDDRVTERRSQDGRRQWKVPCMLGVQGEQSRSEIVQVTVCQDESPRVEFGERLEADELVALFWAWSEAARATPGCCSAPSGWEHRPHPPRRPRLNPPPPRLGGEDSTMAGPW